MPIFPDKTDLFQTLDGDLVVTANGDLALVSGFDWLAREINKVIRTINPQWFHHPTIGAGLEEFVGQPNTRAVANQIERRVLDAIYRSSIPNTERIGVQVIPVDLDVVTVIVYFDADVRITLSKTIMDFKNGSHQPVRDPALEEILYRTPEDPIHRTAPPNKYRVRNSR